MLFRSECRNDRPFSGSEIFKAVRKHGLSVPRVEFVFKPPHSGQANQLSIASPECSKACSISRVEGSEITVEIGGFE